MGSSIIPLASWTGALSRSRLGFHLAVLVVVLAACGAKVRISESGAGGFGGSGGAGDSVGGGGAGGALADAGVPGPAVCYVEPQSDSCKQCLVQVSLADGCMFDSAIGNSVADCLPGCAYDLACCAACESTDPKARDALAAIWECICGECPACQPAVLATGCGE